MITANIVIIASAAQTKWIIYDDLQRINTRKQIFAVKKCKYCHSRLFLHLGFIVTECCFCDF